MRVRERFSIPILPFPRILLWVMNIIIMEIIPDELIELAKERDQLRKQGQFKEADQIRLRIEEKGYELRDNENGYKIIKK